MYESLLENSHDAKKIVPKKGRFELYEVELWTVNCNKT